MRIEFDLTSKRPRTDWRRRNKDYIIMSTAVMPQNGMYDFGDIILKVNFPLHFGCVLTRQSSQSATTTTKLRWDLVLVRRLRARVSEALELEATKSTRKWIKSQNEQHVDVVCVRSLGCCEHGLLVSGADFPFGNVSETIHMPQVVNLFVAVINTER